MNYHTAAGRSARRCVISQSSSIAHSSSHGPSRNACSAGLSAGGFRRHELLPVRPAGEQFAVPPHRARIERLAFGGRHRRAAACGTFFMKGRVSSRIRSGRTLKSSSSANGTETAIFHRQGRRAENPVGQRAAASSTPVLAARAGAPIGENANGAHEQHQPAGDDGGLEQRVMHRTAPFQIKSLTPSRSSSNSRCVACIFSRLNSLMAKPWTMLYSPLLQVTG